MCARKELNHRENSQTEYLLALSMRIHKILKLCKPLLFATLQNDVVSPGILRYKHSTDYEQYT